MPGLADRVAAIPPVTRFFTISTALACIATSLQLFELTDFIISYDTIRFMLVAGWHAPGLWLDKTKLRAYFLLQSYRFFTSFFVPHGLVTRNGFSCLSDMYFFYNFSQHLESRLGFFHGNFPDYCWLILVCGFFITMLSLLFQKMALITFSCHHSMLTGCLTYIWLRCYKDLQIQYQGLFFLKAYYVPMCLLLVHMISGKEAFCGELIGITAGYLYQCIQSDTLPLYNLILGVYGHFDPSQNVSRRVGFDQSAAETFPPAIFDVGYLKAPKWLYRLVKYPYDTSNRTTAFKREPPRRVRPSGATSATTTGFSAFRGPGHRLGS